MRSVVQIHLGPPTNILAFSGDIAQLGERSLCKAEVTGSIPVISTKDTRKPGDASPRCSLTTEYGTRKPIWIGLFPYGLSGYAAILHSRSRSGSCLTARFQPERAAEIFTVLPLLQGALKPGTASVDWAEHTCDLPGTCFDQAMKGIQRMPWHRKAMKDVVSCDKPRVGANNL